VDVRGRVDDGGRADIEDAAWLVSRGQRRDGAVVTRARSCPGDGGAAQTSIVGLTHASWHATDHRKLVIGDGDVEGGTAAVAVDVSRRVGDGGRANVESAAWIVGSGQGRDGAVVTRGGGCPGDGGAAQTSIVSLAHASWHATDHRCLIIGNGDVEGGAAAVAVDVSCRVSDSGGADVEGAARFVRADQRRYGAVVTRGRNCPGNRGAAQTSIVGLAHARRNVNDRWCLVVGDGDVEGGAAAVAVDVSGRVSDGGCADGKSVAWLVRRGQGRDGAVVTRCRSCPGDRCAAGAWIVGLTEARWHATDHRQFVVGNGDIEGSQGSLAAHIDSGVGDGCGSNSKYSVWLL